MSQYSFGLGQVVLTPSGANATPVQVAVISDVTVDFSFDLKELRGQKQFAVDTARGMGKITGKAKSADINGGVILSALGGGAVQTVGTVTGVSDEPATIPATPYQVTTVNSVTWSQDLGVRDLTSNIIMTQVSGSPATKQYSVAAGVYTFAAADTGHNVAISSLYTTSGAGVITTLSNSNMGGIPVLPYSLNVFNNYGAKSLGFSFPSVSVPKLSYAMKAEAYTDQDLDFQVFQSATSLVVAKIYTAG